MSVSHVNLKTKMWIQLAAALFFAGITIAEATGLKAQTFGLPMGWIIFVLAGLVMLFETWRTWRKMKTETNESLKRTEENNA